MLMGQSLDAYLWVSNPMLMREIFWKHGFVMRLNQMVHVSIIPEVLINSGWEITPENLLKKVAIYCWSFSKIDCILFWKCNRQGPTIRGTEWAHRTAGDVQSGYLVHCMQWLWLLPSQCYCCVWAARLSYVSTCHSSCVCAGLRFIIIFLWFVFLTLKARKL